jgi:glycosyltransferase involved in cell wall biosynthesis
VKVLWVAGEHFEPLDSGLYRYSHDVAASLEAAGVEVTKVARARRAGQVGAPGWSLAAPQRQLRTLARVATGNCVKVAASGGRDVNRLVDAAVRRGPRVVVIDHLRAAGALAAVPADVPVVYLAQNHETSVKARAVAGCPPGPRRAAYRIDRRRVAAVERRLCQRAALVCAVSDDDARAFAQLQGVPPARLLVVPPPWTAAVAPAADLGRRPRRVVLVTDLRWGLKVDNTAELLEGISATLHRAGVEVVVAGPGQRRSGLVERFPTVRFVGFVPDLAELLRTCRIGLVHDPRGGGVKLKALEYVANRVAVVARAGDLAGLPLGDGGEAVTAHDTATMAQRCLELIDDDGRLDRLQSSALEACRAVLSPERIGRTLAGRLDDLCCDRPGRHQWT